MKREKFTLKMKGTVPSNDAENNYTVVIKRSPDGKMFFFESLHENGDLGFSDNSDDALTFGSYFLANMFLKVTKEALEGTEDQALLCAIKPVDDKTSEFTFV
jgi:hypothetical protein